MPETGDIRARQFMILVIFYTISSSILYLPGSLSSLSKQDSWIGILLGTGIGLLVILFYNAIENRHPHMTFVEFCQVSLGKWLGNFVALFYISALYFVTSFDARDLGEFINTEIMKETPVESLLILFLSIICLGTWYGLEVLARLGALLFPIFLLFFIVLMVAILPQMQLQNFQPILENGFKPIAASAISYLGFPIFEFVILLMIYPFVNNQKEAGRALLSGTFIGSILLTIVTILCVGVLGSAATTVYQYPSFVIAQKINIGGFFQRVEAILMVIWFFSIFFKSTLTFYAAVLGLAQVFNLKDYKSLILPFSMSVYVLGLVIAPNTIHFAITQKVYTFYSFTYGFCVPVLLLIVDTIRKKRNAA